MSNMNNTKNIKDTADILMRNIKATSVSGNGISGLSSGIESLDKITHGFQEGDFITIAGRPSMGKTAFALSMLKSIAIDRRETVLYISPSMTGEKLVKRLLSCVCKIPLDQIMSGQLSVEQWDNLERGINVIRESSIFIDDTPGINIARIDELIRMFAQNNNVKAVFVDYLQLIQPRYNPNRTRNDEVADTVYSLKALALELHVPFIVLSQTSRSTKEDSPFDYPKLSDLRDSGTIEEASDLVVFIHRPEYYHKYTDENGNDLHGISELYIEKNLMGYTGKIQLKSHMGTAIFEPTALPQKHFELHGEPPFGFFEY